MAAFTLPTPPGLSVPSGPHAFVFAYLSRCSRQQFKEFLADKLGYSDDTAIDVHTWFRVRMQVRWMLVDITTMSFRGTMRDHHTTTPTVLHTIRVTWQHIIDRFRDYVRASASPPVIDTAPQFTSDEWRLTCERFGCRIHIGASPSLSLTDQEHGDTGDIIELRQTYSSAIEQALDWLKLGDKYSKWSPVHLSDETIATAKQIWADCKSNATTTIARCDHYQCTVIAAPQLVDRPTHTNEFAVSPRDYRPSAQPLGGDGPLARIALTTFMQCTANDVRVFVWNADKRFAPSTETHAYWLADIHAAQVNVIVMNELENVTSWRSLVHCLNRIYDGRQVWKDMGGNDEVLSRIFFSQRCLLTLFVLNNNRFEYW